MDYILYELNIIWIQNMRHCIFYMNWIFYIDLILYEPCSNTSSLATVPPGPFPLCIINSQVSTLPVIVQRFWVHALNSTHFQLLSLSPNVFPSSCFFLTVNQFPPVPCLSTAMVVVVWWFVCLIRLSIQARCPSWHKTSPREIHWFVTHSGWFNIMVLQHRLN